VTSPRTNAGLAVALVSGGLAALPAGAQELPGEARRSSRSRARSPRSSSRRSSSSGLEELGYEVEKPKETQVQLAHVAVGQGDANYLSAHWHPLHIEFF
jgi:hypothetical protein